MSEREAPRRAEASADADARGVARSISGELLGAVISLMPDAAVIVDGSGRIVSTNEQAEELFAYPEGTLVGQPIESLLPERARQRHRQHRATFARSPQKRSMGAGLELTGRRRDGSEFPIDISLAPIESAGEQLVVAAVRDLTDQRAVTAAQAELATIVRSSLDAIISTTLEGVITNWNPAAEALLGYAAGDIIGEHVACLVPDDSSAVLEELLDAAFASSHRGARDTRWRHRDGHEIDVAVSISPLRDASGEVRGFASMVRDITERKIHEDELRRLLAEEERLGRQHGATADIRLALLAGDPLQDILTLICDRAAVLVDAPVAVIAVEAHEVALITAAVGLGPEMLGSELSAVTFVAESSSNTDRASTGAESSSERSLAAFAGGPTVSVPVIGGGTDTVWLTLYRPPGAEEFSHSEHLFADTLAAQASLAFEFERARRDHDEMMLFGDRERIARDLHDHVIQQLFAAGMGLQSVLLTIEQPRTVERVSGVIDTLDTTIRQIRNTIFGLSREAEQEGQLRAHVLRVVREAQPALGFTPGVAFDGPVDSVVPDEIRWHVVAVVREALSNVARHAAAKVVQVRVAVPGAELLVTITDDGVGVGAPTRSSGLANLQTRALHLGGSCELTSPAGGGTCLEWRVPLPV